jgi:hypothetical protein
MEIGTACVDACDERLTVFHACPFALDICNMPSPLSTLFRAMVQNLPFSRQDGQFGHSAGLSEVETTGIDTWGESAGNGRLPPKMALMAMLSEQEFQDCVRVLQGLEVSLAWKGYGSAIFLELGRHEQGEACLCVEWDRRVENGSSILFGSSDTRPEIADGIRGLQGSRVDDIAAVGAVPEILASFSNEQRLRSMAMTIGDPQWGVRLPSGSWLSAKGGALWLDAKSEGSPDEYAKEIKMAEDARGRWGVPTAEPVKGRCDACDCFRRLDGDFALLDYGVCIAEKSPFDDRVVDRFSGCPAFSAPDAA